MKQFTLDIVISLTLFIGATFTTGAVQQALFPDAMWLYPIIFAVGMIPCLLYMRFRNVLSFNRYDLLAFSPMLILVGVIITFLPAIYAVIAAVVLTPLSAWIRRKLSVGNQDSDQSLGKSGTEKSTG